MSGALVKKSLRDWLCLVESCPVHAASHYSWQEPTRSGGTRWSNRLGALDSGVTMGRRGVTATTDP